MPGSVIGPGDKMASKIGKKKKKKKTLAFTGFIF